METKMKKRFSFLLAGVLALSLTACGGGGGMSKEEMLEASEGQMNLAAISKAKSDNPVNAEEKYVGKIYEITGIVDTIESDHVELLVVNSPIENHALSGYSDLVHVDVPLSEEELKELSTKEVINVVGRLSAIDGGYQMDQAYYVDNTVTFTGEVTKFILDESMTNHLMWIDSELNTSAGFNNCRYVYVVEPVTAFENLEEAEIGGVTVKEGDTVTVQGTAVYENMTKSSAGTLVVYTLNFDLNTIASVTKE